LDISVYTYLLAILTYLKTIFVLL